MAATNVYLSFLLYYCLLCQIKELAPAIIPEVAGSIQRIIRMAPSIVISESSIYHVPDFTDVLYVIERGEVIFSRKPEDLTHEKEILRIIPGVT